MAIQKSKTLLNGLSGNYWVVRGVYISPDASGVRAFMDLYQDSRSAVTGVPIHSQDVALFGIDNPINSVTMVGLIQDKLVALPGDFVSGVIV